MRVKRSGAYGQEGIPLSSQWGRDSNFQTGRKRGGGLLTAVALILALGVGFAAGFAGLRFLQPDTTAALEAAKSESSGIRAERDAALAELDAKQADQAAQAARIEELETTVRRQAAELDAMAGRLEESSNAASAASAARSDDDAAVRMLREERDRLEQEKLALEQRLAALEAERQQFEQQAKSERQRLDAELAGLRDEVVPGLNAERDRLRQQVSELEGAQGELEARLRAADEKQATDQATIAELQARLAEAERAVEALQAQLAQSGSQSAAADEAADPPAETLTEEQGGSVGGTGESNASAATPRDPQLVSNVLRVTPGLDDLSETGRRELSDRLAAGECVTDALGAVFERVPVVTLRNLIRSLNSDC